MAQDSIATAECFTKHFLHEGKLWLCLLARWIIKLLADVSVKWRGILRTMETERALRLKKNVKNAAEFKQEKEGNHKLWRDFSHF